MWLCARTSTLAGLIKGASPLSADLASRGFIVKTAATLKGWNRRKRLEKEGIGGKE